jgi:hypothetical protein
VHSNTAWDPSNPAPVKMILTEAAFQERIYITFSEGELVSHDYRRREVRSAMSNYDSRRTDRAQFYAKKRGFQNLRS